MARTRVSEAVVLPFQEPAVDTRLDTPLLTPAQAAELLSVKPSWIYEAVRTGSLPCLRIGGHIRFTRPMLKEWLRGRWGQ
jgi:excisionase family DNA binding protein